MIAKTAFVTGANGGLGMHVTKALLDAGFAVVGLAPKIQQSDFDHPNFTALEASLDSLAAAKKAADSVIARFGKIDALAHLVGGFAGGATVADTDDATFQRMFDMNVNSAFHILRAVIPQMRKAGADALSPLAAVPPRLPARPSGLIARRRRRWCRWCGRSRLKTKTPASLRTSFYPERWILPPTAETCPAPTDRSGCSRHPSPALLCGSSGRRGKT